MSADPDQEFFADGTVEDIISSLARYRYFDVIARNSTFTYKGRAVDVKQVGRELGARYVLEGSVRKVGQRIRITAQLIDAATANHVWAGRVEGGVDDLFELQDQVTASVVGAIEPELRRVETDRAVRRPVKDADTYITVMRGGASLNKWTRAGADEALQLAYQAIERDPEFGSSYSLVMACYVVRDANGWSTDLEHDRAEVRRLAGEAAKVGRTDALALSFTASRSPRSATSFEPGLALIDRALVMTRKLATVMAQRLRAGLAGRAPTRRLMEQMQRAMRLSPRRSAQRNPFLMASASTPAASLQGSTVAMMPPGTWHACASSMPGSTIAAVASRIATCSGRRIAPGCIDALRAAGLAP